MINSEVVAKKICLENGYTFESFIGAGNFKYTYKVKQNDTELALKIFGENNTAERTNREIGSMMNLNSTNIVKLYNVEVIRLDGKDIKYCVEEFLPGGSLGDKIKGKSLNRKEVIEVLLDILKALSDMEPLKLVHRDIKPDNIMFRKKEAILVDFGLVRDLTLESLTQTHMVQGPGTPFFASPEQLNNKKELIDWRSDQFSLGVTLIYAFTKKHPYEGGNVCQTVDNVALCEKKNKLVCELLSNNNLSFLLKMVNPYPFQRYLTVGKLLTAIEEVI